MLSIAQNGFHIIFSGKLKPRYQEIIKKEIMGGSPQSFECPPGPISSEGETIVVVTTALTLSGLGLTPDDLVSVDSDGNPINDDSLCDSDCYCV